MKMTLRATLAFASLMFAAVTSLADPTVGEKASRRPDPGKPQSKSPASSPSGKPQATTSAVEYGDARMKIDSVGLSLPIPVGASIGQDSIGSRADGMISSGDGSWIMLISAQSVTTDASLIGAGEAMRDQLIVSAGRIFEQDPDGKVLGVKGRVLEDVRDLVLADKPPAVRFYVNVMANERSAPLVHGFTLFKIGDDQFLTLELRTSESNFPKARAVYENMIASATFTDPVGLASGRIAILEAGSRILEGVDEKLLRTIIAERPERWLRLYIAAPAGAPGDATEIGYQRVRATMGQRGMLDPAKSKDKWSIEDKEDGYVIQLDGRALDDGKMIDWQSVLFLSLDRQRETWVTRNALRKIGAKSSEAQATSEIGNREGNSITVRFIDAGGVRKDAKPYIKTHLEISSYISRVEAFLVPQILIRAKIPAEFGFYAYNPDLREVTIRRDSLHEPADQPGAWMLTSKLAEDREPQLACFNELGQMIWTKVPQQDRTIVWEPIEFNSLVRLWRDKGLPMD